MNLNLSRYNKLFGALVGSLVAIAAAFGYNPEWATAENIGLAVTAMSIVAAAVWGAPKNTE